MTKKYHVVIKIAGVELIHECEGLNQAIVTRTKLRAAGHDAWLRYIG